MSSTRPPALARFLLRALLPEHEVVDALEGDLAEGFARRAAQSPVHARWWYRRKVLMLPYVALHRAIRRLRAREESTRVRTGGGGMDVTTMDLRIAVRSLLRRPAFAGVAVMTLALSVGAATLLYSVVDGVLMTPLPYASPQELVSVYLTSDEWRDGESELFREWWDSHTMTLDHTKAFREAPGPLTGISAYTYRQFPVRTDGDSDDVAEAIMVDAHTFDVLGVGPAMGRFPSADEVATSAKVAVLRHETWRSRFGGDPDVLGRGFGLGEDTYTVIGVMPAGFFFPTEVGGDLWIPVREEARAWPSFYGVARLASGSGTADATEFLERVARRMGESDPERAGFGARAVPHLDNVVGSVRGGIRLLFGTALLVVLVACVNLANLFLARAAGRREELAIRASLGAGTGSLITVMLSEALVIGLVGGSLGIALAAGAINPFVDALAVSLRSLPRRETIGLDGGVLLFSLAATLATTLAAGLGPTLAWARRAPANSMGTGRWSGSGQGTRRGQRVLLGTQAALTVVLVSAAGLLCRSFFEAASVDLGMDTDHVAVLQIEPDAQAYTGNELAIAQERIRQRVAQVPGVSAAGLTMSLPSQGGVLLPSLRPAGADDARETRVALVFVSEGYFGALGIPVLAGRGLLNEDNASEAKRAVISESLAVQFFGGVDVVGRRIEQESENGPGLVEIVGVVGDVRQLSVFQEETFPTVYYPIGRARTDFLFVTVAVDGNPEDVLDTAREAVLSAGVTVEIQRVSTLDRLLRDGVRHLRLRMVLMASLAALAAILAVIGISGVVAHYLSEQMRDVGIRMALGAAAPREIRRVIRHALGPTVLGLAVGLLLAIASSHVMESFVFGIETTDPLTFGGVTVLMLLTAAGAAWVPARRASGVDPARVLNRD